MSEKYKPSEEEIEKNKETQEESQEKTSLREDVRKEVVRRLKLEREMWEGGKIFSPSFVIPPSKTGRDISKNEYSVLEGLYSGAIGNQFGFTYEPADGSYGIQISYSPETLKAITELNCDRIIRFSPALVLKNLNINNEEFLSFISASKFIQSIKEKAQQMRVRNQSGASVTKADIIEGIEEAIKVDKGRINDDGGIFIKLLKEYLGQSNIKDKK